MSLKHLPIPRLNLVTADVWASGQPAPDQLRKAAEAGLRTVVNLCPPGEAGWDEQAVAEAAGLRYASIPVGGACDLSPQAARRLHDVLASSPRPILVHCASSNRVGALFALKARFVDGHSPEQALAHGRDAGLAALEGAVSRLVQ